MITPDKAIECLKGLAAGTWVAWAWPGMPPDRFVPVDAHGAIIHGGPVLLSDLITAVTQPSEAYVEIALQRVQEAVESAKRNAETAPNLTSFANGVEYAYGQMAIDIRKSVGAGPF